MPLAFAWLRVLHIGRSQLAELARRGALEASLGLHVRLLTRPQTPSASAIYTLVEIVDATAHATELMAARLTVRGAAQHMPAGGLRKLEHGVGVLEIELGTCSDRELR